MPGSWVSREFSGALPVNANTALLGQLCEESLKRISPKHSSLVDTPVFSILRHFFFLKKKEKKNAPEIQRMLLDDNWKTLQIMTSEIWMSSTTFCPPLACSPGTLAFPAPVPAGVAGRFFDSTALHFLIRSPSTKLYYKLRKLIRVEGTGRAEQKMNGNKSLVVCSLKFISINTIFFRASDHRGISPEIIFN